MLGEGLGCELLGGKMSPAAGFVARMMAENKLKHSGKYKKPTAPAHKDSKMKQWIPFDYKKLANGSQDGVNKAGMNRWGQSKTAAYGASPFIIKHFKGDTVAQTAPKETAEQTRARYSALSKRYGKMAEEPPAPAESVAPPPASPAPAKSEVAPPAKSEISPPPAAPPPPPPKTPVVKAATEEEKRAARRAELKANEAARRQTPEYKAMIEAHKRESEERAKKWAIEKAARASGAPPSAELIKEREEQLEGWRLRIPRAIYERLIYAPRTRDWYNESGEVLNKAISSYTGKGITGASEASGGGDLPDMCGI